MRPSPWKETIITVTFLAAATALIAMSSADLAVSAKFFIGGQWPVGELWPWKMLYRIDRYPALILAVSGLGLCIASFVRHTPSHWRRSGIFLVLLLALGPGLLVNALFKDHWGRPRPRDIVQFEGNMVFLQPWQRGEDGNGRSFPSGHASAAFYMTAPFFIYRNRRKLLARIWLSGGLIFGVFMSIARTAQGGHFLSDDLWAWGMVHLCAIALAAMLKLDREPGESSAPGS